MENETQKMQIRNVENVGINIDNHKIVSFKINIVLLLQVAIIFFCLIIFFSLPIYKEQKINKYNDIKTMKTTKNNSNFISDKISVLKMIANNDEQEYKGIQECLINDPDSKYCIYHLLSPKKVVGQKRILLGKKSDGSYVLLDNFTNIKIAYSFGIQGNVIFDKALADRGIDVYMYDHTINKLPYENPKFHWKKIGICGKSQNQTNLKDLEFLINENGHKNEDNMILKLDIEHNEWNSLIDLNEKILKQFKFIVIEYHFRDEKRFKNNNIYYKVLKKIAKNHQVFYIRCNFDRSRKVNFGVNRICAFLEVSYVIKKDSKFTKDETIYPMYEFDYEKAKFGKLETNLNILKLFD